MNNHQKLSILSMVDQMIDNNKRDVANSRLNMGDKELVKFLLNRTIEQMKWSLDQLKHVIADDEREPS